MNSASNFSIIDYEKVYKLIEQTQAKKMRSHAFSVLPEFQISVRDTLPSPEDFAEMQKNNFSQLKIPFLTETIAAEYGFSFSDEEGLTGFNTDLTNNNQHVSVLSSNLQNLTFQMSKIKHRFYPDSSILKDISKKKTANLTLHQTGEPFQFDPPENPFKNGFTTSFSLQESDDDDVTEPIQMPITSNETNQKIEEKHHLTQTQISTDLDDINGEAMKTPNRIEKVFQKTDELWWRPLEHASKISFPSSIWSQFAPIKYAFRVFRWYNPSHDPFNDKDYIGRVFSGKQKQMLRLRHSIGGQELDRIVGARAHESIYKDPTTGIEYTSDVFSMKIIFNDFHERYAKISYGFDSEGKLRHKYLTFCKPFEILSSYKRKGELDIDQVHKDTDFPEGEKEIFSEHPSHLQDSNNNSNSKPIIPRIQRLYDAKNDVVLYAYFV